MARLEANELVDGLGRGSVQALELGNEPALYGIVPVVSDGDRCKVPGRPRGYDVPAYIARLRPVLRRAAELPLAGPALGASKWMHNLGPFLSSQPRLGIVTLHRYPLQLCYTSTKSLDAPDARPPDDPARQRPAWPTASRATSKAPTPIGSRCVLTRSTASRAAPTARSATRSPRACGRSTPCSSSPESESTASTSTRSLARATSSSGSPMPAVAGRRPSRPSTTAC